MYVNTETTDYTDYMQATDTTDYSYSYDYGY